MRCATSRPVPASTRAGAAKNLSEPSTLFSAPASALAVPPVTATPTAPGATTAAPVIDPVTGNQVDPVTGDPIAPGTTPPAPVIDPVTGNTVDPVTGDPIDPATGAPLTAAPATTTAAPTG